VEDFVKFIEKKPFYSFLVNWYNSIIWKTKNTTLSEQFQNPIEKSGTGTSIFNFIMHFKLNLLLKYGNTFSLFMVKWFISSIKDDLSLPKIDKNSCCIIWRGQIVNNKLEIEKKNAWQIFIIQNYKNNIKATLYNFIKKITPGSMTFYSPYVSNNT
jgi:hypothetical protein